MSGEDTGASPSRTRPLGNDAAALAVAIIEHSDDAIISKSLDGQVLSWNRGAVKLFGYTATEIIGQPITRLFPADRLAEEPELLARMLSGGQVTHFETQRIRKDGSLVHVSVSLSPIYDLTGNIVALSKVARDISDRVALQARIAEQAADLQQVLDHSPWMIGMWNADRTNRFANEAYARSLGSTPEAMKGRHVADVLGPQLYPLAKPRIDAALAGKPQLFERSIPQPDESVRFDQVSYVADARESVGGRGLFVFIQDITQRRRAEMAVMESAERFRLLYERTPAMVYSIDPQGRLLFVSDLWLHNLGFAREEVIGRHILDFHTSESARKTRERHLSNFIRDGEGLRDVDCQFVRKDGSVIDVLLSAIVQHDERGALAGGLSVIVDVTARKRAEQALRSSEAFLDRAGRIASVGAWSYDLAAGRLHWSNETCRIHDLEPGHQPSLEEAIGYYSPSARTAIEHAVAECAEHQRAFDLELDLVTATGRKIWVRSAGEAEVLDGKVRRIFGAFQDITTRKLVEREIADQHELMRVTLDSIGDAVITTDAHGVIQWLNPVAASLTGWLLEEATGRPIDQVFHIIHEETRKPALSPVTRVLQTNALETLAEHTSLIARDGREYGIEDSAAPMRDAEGVLIGVVLVFHDVTEQRRLSKEISVRASRDALTGLLNRSEFELRLQRAFKGAREDGQVHALLAIDLDQFKLVNDACGHAAGDDLLRQVAAMFQGVVRSRDTLARLGGDEFGVIMEHCTVKQAHRVAEQMCHCLEQFRFIHDDRRFRVGASIGLVPMDGRWSSTASVMQAADTACFAAKEAGRNRVHEWFDTDLLMKTRQGEMQWATRLEQALDERRFKLFGQRIMRCDGGSAGLHLEILLRLTDTDGRMITAAAFFPAAERFHMASRIDRWVLREVLDWIEQNDSDGLEMVAMNLSGQSIGDRSFHRYAPDLIARMAFSHRKLCLEITETAAITHMGDAAEFIKAMRALGVRVALDDFGAGASSFGYLKTLPVDFLKIDGQFVRDILQDPLDLTAVKCFKEVATVCGLQTVAEYVEREDVRAELERIGIDYVQGFLFHRPEPLDRLLAAAQCKPNLQDPSSPSSTAFRQRD